MDKSSPASVFTRIPSPSPKSRNPFASTAYTEEVTDAEFALLTYLRTGEWPVFITEDPDYIADSLSTVGGRTFAEIRQDYVDYLKTEVSMFKKLEKLLSTGVYGKKPKRSKKAKKSKGETAAPSSAETSPEETEGANGN